MISLTSDVKTWAHEWPVGVKFTLLALSSLGLFCVKTALGQSLILCFVIGFHLCAGWTFFKDAVRNLRFLWFFWLVIVGWHGLTDELEKGVTIALRMSSAVALANLLTMTTRMSDMMAFISWGLGPLERFGLRVRVIELTFALCVRFVPTLKAHMDQLQLAWRARSVKRGPWRVITPFTLLTLDDSEHIGEAIKARSYTLGSNADDT